MKVVYAPQALRDIDSILAHVSRRSPSGSKKVSLAIEHAIELCGQVPYAGGKTDLKNLYRSPLSRHRLTIFYRVDEGRDEIEVVRVVRAGRVKNLRQLPDDDI